VHELREKYQEHSHEALGAEPDLTFDEENGFSQRKIVPEELFVEDYQI
jgi:hypothetical protein